MKKIILIISSLLLALLFSACGGGESDFDTGDTKIVIPLCTTGVVTIVTNDLLVKEDSNTTVLITHDSNGTKTICVDFGSAHLVREN